MINIEVVDFMVGYLKSASKDPKLSEDVKIFVTDLLVLSYAYYPELQITEDRDLPAITQLSVYN